jgi:hypothetical protein
MDGLLMKYFVLKPKGNDIFAKASRMAMRKYAEVIKDENPQFSAELREWADQANAEAYAASIEKDPQ